MSDPIEDLQAQLRAFARERDWEQFHTPKNLAMALAGEVAELLEIFQWLSPDLLTAMMQGPPGRWWRLRSGGSAEEPDSSCD